MLAAMWLVLLIPPACLMGFVSLPNVCVNKGVGFFRRLATVLTGIQATVGVCLAIAFVAGWVPVVSGRPDSLLSLFPSGVAVHYDGVASLMFALVSFVGWVICRYSTRYLDGEASQGRYYRWAAFTIGSVSLMVVAGNLLLFLAMWILTSLGLHHLLLHYGHRPAAQRAAWTKFTISRLGDMALLIATIIIYNEFKTLDFAELYALAGSLTTASPALQVAAFLLVAGAVTKSAQFPFHTWLPLTMETPTPVSALMHAGIVNAGGYLIIRTSPMVSLTPSAMSTLAMIGGFTACFAAIIMMTQTSIKKSLAYSTIAQMGFMLLQCGMGAYSAAMLHILAHSLYKAHAFLSSGNVIAERPGLEPCNALNSEVGLLTFAMSAAGIMAFLWTVLTLFGIDPVQKPGGLLLGSILGMALTQWVTQVMRSGSRRLGSGAVLSAAGLCIVYATSFFIIDGIIARSLPKVVPSNSVWLVAMIVVTGFMGMFVLQFMLAKGRRNASLNRWYIHVANGFYVDSALRRVFGPLVKS